jgi:tetratricopeptide (TPR) repeat protein
MAKQIDKFNELMINAETQQNSGNLDKAIKFYTQAEKTAGQIGFEEQEKTIRQTINNLQLKKALAEARKAEEEQEWKQAADTYAKALELSNSFSTPDNTNDIATRMAAASFRHELMEGQKAFTASQWQKTIEMLQGAQKILNENPQIATEEEKTEIRKLLVNSRLFHTLSGAKIAYEKGEWDLAVNQYKNAVYLLENNKEILGNKATENIKKIEKTILMTEIAREQYQHSLAVADNNLQQSLNSYRTIASLIESSPFGDDKTLEKILADAKAQMVVLENEIKINSRVNWLKENYEEIFRKMYPSAITSELLNPQVVFIKEEGDKLIFTMSCVEKRQGRAFRLELNYQYDQKKDAWDIYSGEL